MGRGEGQGDALFPPKTSESGEVHLYIRGRGASMRRDATWAAKESVRLRRLWVEEVGGGRGAGGLSLRMEGK